MMILRKPSAWVALAFLLVLLSVNVCAEAGRLACLQMNAAQVDVVTVIDRELHAGYTVAGAGDRLAVIEKLNKIEYRPTTNAVPDMDGLRLLQVRFKNGQTYDYWCHRNVLMNGDTQLTDGLACADLYKVLDRCVQNNPANIEWLGYLNPYRVTSMEVAGNGKNVVYQTTSSEQSRNTILNICTKLRSVVPSKVRTVNAGGNLSYSGNGIPVYTVLLSVENGKGSYQVNLFHNGEIGISVDNINYSLAYTSGQQMRFDALISALKACTA